MRRRFCPVSFAGPLGPMPDTQGDPSLARPAPAPQPRRTSAHPPMPADPHRHDLLSEACKRSRSGLPRFECEQAPRRSWAQRSAPEESVHMLASLSCFSLSTLPRVASRVVPSVGGKRLIGHCLRPTAAAPGARCPSGALAAWSAGRRGPRGASSAAASSASAGCRCPSSCSLVASTSKPRCGCARGIFGAKRRKARAWCGCGRRHCGVGRVGGGALEDGEQETRAQKGIATGGPEQEQVQEKGRMIRAGATRQRGTTRTRATETIWRGPGRETRCPEAIAGRAIED